MCLRCAVAAYSSPISIQLQHKGSAELPLIGRTEELCLGRTSWGTKFLLQENKQQHARKFLQKTKRQRQRILWLCLCRRAKYAMNHLEKHRVEILQRNRLSSKI